VAASIVVATTRWPMAIVPPALASRRAVTSATAVSAFWLVVVSIPLVAFRSTMVVASHQFF